MIFSAKNFIICLRLEFNDTIKELLANTRLVAVVHSKLYWSSDNRNIYNTYIFLFFASAISVATRTN